MEHVLALMWRYLAQTPGPSPSVLEQYGPGGAVAAIALALMWSERQRANKAEDEVRELNRVFRELTIPAVTRATEAITEVMRLVRKDHSP